MSNKIREIMTQHPVTVQSNTSALDAARTMRESNIGCLAVMRDGKLDGVVTDRDLVVRVMAKGLDPSSTKLENVYSREIASLSPTSTTDEAVRLMREKSIRRIPVVDDGSIIGMVSLGDLAVALDPQSALADISKASPNL